MDGEEMNREYPDTFKIPSLERRHALRVGENVKVGFKLLVALEGEAIGERMWVHVDSVERDAEGISYVGRLYDVPATPQLAVELQHGSIVKFRPKHVLSTED